MGAASSCRLAAGERPELEAFVRAVAETTARVERRDGRVVALRIGQARYEALAGR